MNYYKKTVTYFSSNPTRLKSEFLLLICAFIWGFSFPSVKLALDYSSPNAFIFFRFFITIIIFYFAFRKRIRNFSKRDIMNGFILGIYLFIGFIAQTVGMMFTSAANSAFITGTNLILIPFTQLLILKLKPKFENIIGIFIVLTGVYILSGVHYVALNKGVLITFVCAIAFSFHIVYLDKYTRKSEPLALIYGQYVAMTVFSFLSLVFVEIIWFHNFKFEINSFLIFSITFNGFFSTFLALYIAMKFQKYTTPVRAGLIYNMEQVFAVIFAYIMINEILTTHQLFGAFIILGGLLFSEFYSEIKKYLYKDKNLKCKT